MIINPTLHSLQRGKERLGLNRRATSDLAQKAFALGATKFEFAGSFRRYLDKFHHRNHRVNNVRVHGEHVYLFADETLVTIIPVPNQYKKEIRKWKSKTCSTTSTPTQPRRNSPQKFEAA